jgi:hypothetical protein
VYDAFLYFSDGAKKTSDVLDLRGARADTNTVNASKRMVVEIFGMQT